MAFVTYAPLSRLGQWQKEVNRLYGNRLRREDQETSATSDWAPLVDIVEENDRYIISADIPGIDPKDINLTLEKGVLTLRGQRAAEKRGEGTTTRRSERPVGNFYRRFVMSDIADAEGVSAEGKNGVLQIVIPKRPQAQARRIQVIRQYISKYR